jgi:hypothetical protein
MQPPAANDPMRLPPKPADGLPRWLIRAWVGACALLAFGAGVASQLLFVSDSSVSRHGEEASPYEFLGDPLRVGFTWSLGAAFTALLAAALVSAFIKAVLTRKKHKGPNSEGTVPRGRG